MLLFFLLALANLQAKRTGMLSVKGLGKGGNQWFLVRVIGEHASPSDGLQNKPMAAGRHEQSQEAGKGAGQPPGSFTGPHSRDRLL